MLAKENRFVFRGPLPKNIFVSRSFNLRFGKNDSGLKVAVVVSKKVDNRATVRNNIKRRILEIIEKKIDKNTLASLIFYVKKQALSQEGLEEEIAEALNKTINV